MATEVRIHSGRRDDPILEEPLLLHKHHRETSCVKAKQILPHNFHQLSKKNNTKPTQKFTQDFNHKSRIFFVQALERLQVPLEELLEQGRLCVG